MGWRGANGCQDERQNGAQQGRPTPECTIHLSPPPGEFLTAVCPALWPVSGTVTVTKRMVGVRVRRCQCAVTRLKEQRPGSLDTSPGHPWSVAYPRTPDSPPGVSGLGIRLSIMPATSSTMFTYGSG